MNRGNVKMSKVVLPFVTCSVTHNLSHQHLWGDRKESGSLKTQQVKLIFASVRVCVCVCVRVCVCESV